MRKRGGDVVTKTVMMLSKVYGLPTVARSLRIPPSTWNVFSRRMTGKSKRKELFLLEVV